MLQKGQPLNDDESVYRRIPKSFYPGGVTVVPPPWLAFRPVSQDVDGLSVFRSSLSERAHVSGPRGGDVGELSVVQIRGIRDRDGNTPLDVVADPLDGQPGHALIPALNARAYASDKTRVMELALALAERVRIVLVGSPPTSRG